jgi:hypothetical protein
MRQLTIRGFDPELEQRLEQLARREHISLNRAALVLMRRGAGLDERGPLTPTVGNSLDGFIGSWSEEDERTLLDAVAVFEAIDEEMWS